MTLTPTPTAPFSDKIAMLGRMLAACAILRTRSGLSANDPDAEDKLLGEASNIRRIFYPQKEITADCLFPLVVIIPEKRRYVAAAQEQAMFHDRGVLGLMFTDAVTTYSSDVERAARDFENVWGLLLAQLAAQSGADINDELYTKLRLAAIEEDDAPFKSPPEEDQQRWTASAYVYYGQWPEMELIR